MKGILALFLFLSSLALSGCGSEPAQEVRQEEAVQYLVPSRSAEFTRATDVFGPLLVSEGEFEAESAIKPWSAWWLPVSDQYLFEGNGGRSAPLQKYDQYVKKTYRQDPQSAEYERSRIYNVNSAWEGACDGWALASILEKEPITPITVNGVTFSVGDMKALLVKSYEEAVGQERFGQRNDNDRWTVFDDIYPDQFHRFIQAELFERGRPFIMDKDPGMPVWNTPVWKVSFTIERDRELPYVLHVTAWLKGASPWVDFYDQVGTIPVNFKYTYDFFVKELHDGGYRVDFGVWTGESADYHPDFLTAIPERIERASRNKKIDIGVVDEIVKKVYRE